MQRVKVLNQYQLSNEILMQQSDYLTIWELHSMATQSNKEKQMADKSQSTDFVPFDKANTGGIPASMPIGGVPVAVGSKASFAGGKKTVSK
jgi:hypothetical protein